MTTAPKTKTQREIDLERHLEEVASALEDMHRDRDAWRERNPLPDREAEAIAACVVALDKMHDGQHSTTTWPTLVRYSDGRFERVLRYLAARYGVQWIDPPQPEEIHATANEDIRAGDFLVVDASGARRR